MQIYSYCSVQANVRLEACHYRSCGRQLWFLLRFFLLLCPFCELRLGGAGNGINNVVSLLAVSAVALVAFEAPFWVLLVLLAAVAAAKSFIRADCGLGAKAVVVQTH